MLLELLFFYLFVLCAAANTEQSVEISVDNEQIAMSTSAKLDAFLRSIDSIPKEDLVDGDYDVDLPEELTDEYTALNNLRKEDIKENMRWAWKNYATNCMGWDEIRPLTGDGHNFWGGLGMMVVESLDTLYIMGLQDEFNEGREWIQSSLALDIDHFTSVFETTIRLLGGLLSAYALTNDPLFKTKAIDIGTRLLRSHTENLHYANVNLQTGETRHNDRKIHLSEVGSNLLELTYLSEVSGDNSFVEASKRIRNVLRKIPKQDGLLPIHFTEKGEVLEKVYGMGNRADSYYEYLLKGWILTGDEDLREEYCDSLKGLHSLLCHRSSMDHLVVVTDWSSARRSRMHHLHCFLPATLILGASSVSCEQNELESQLAMQLMTTCMAMYNSTKSGLSGDEYEVILTEERPQNLQPTSDIWNDLIPVGLTKYILRPETFESLYVMYSKTKNPVFREWGWKLWETIKKKCKGPYGFADLHNVQDENSSMEDRGETFFYSETMKYLYLLFSEEGPSYLDSYVFNTEAHLIPKQTRSV